MSNYASHEIWMCRVLISIGNLFLLFAFTAIPLVASSNARSDFTAEEILDKAYAGMGGRQVLQNITGFALDVSRERWLMGEGPEAGRGLFRASTSDVRVLHDITNQRLRLDYSHKNLYGADRQVTEIIVNQAGYVLGHDDYYLQLLKKSEELSKTMPADRKAMTKKTERLLNPHILLRELIRDPSLASIGNVDLTAGKRISENEIFPITINLGAVSGQRRIITNDEWLQAWQGKKYFDAAVAEIKLDPAWMHRWKDGTKVNNASHYQLEIKDDVYPITLYIDKTTGRISKLHTMEHDVIYGDVPLEISFQDWQIFDGIYFPMHLKLSIAGTPAMEVKRSQVSINPIFEESDFSITAGLNYHEDEQGAARGARASQMIQAFVYAASPKKPLVKLGITPKEFSPGVLFLRTVPNDAIRTMAVIQEKRVIVVEPGMPDQKGDAIIEWLAQNVPEKPLSHVIITHHHVDHAGGVRPYIAAGATIVAHETAKQYYEMVAARREATILPDALDRNPTALKIAVVNDNGMYKLDDPVRPITVYPVLDRHSTDGIMVVLDKQGIVFNGDLYSAGNEPGTGPEAAKELDQAIRRHGIKVRSMVGSHGCPVSYEEFKAHIENDRPPELTCTQSNFIY